MYMMYILLVRNNCWTYLLIYLVLAYNLTTCWTRCYEQIPLHDLLHFNEQLGSRTFWL